MPTRRNAPDWWRLDPEALAERGLTVDEAATAYDWLYGADLIRERKAGRMLNLIVQGRVTPADAKAASLKFREFPPPEFEPLS